MLLQPELVIHMVESLRIPRGLAINDLLAQAISSANAPNVSTEVTTGGVITHVPHTQSVTLMSLTWC